jgi:prepilin-type N-terminal cleavage/methylation domain-containing protein/prepilin-type processing-associated H-X9-DG protein
MRTRTAMTLVELLVVLVIVAILLGLLVPAVQRARESANRARCTDNLHQIGLACHAYHDAEGSFPPGYTAWRCADPLVTRPGWGWAAHLLPFLEQVPLQQTIIFARPIEHPVNADACRTGVALLLCPSDPDVPATFPITDASGQRLTEAAPIGYAACYGSGELDEVPGPKEGVFYRNSRIRLADITDGSSTTLLIGDRAWSHAMAPWAGAVNRGLVRGGPRNPWRDSSEAVYPAPNFACVQANALNNRGDPDGSLDEFYSEHPGGVNLLFADGAVHFLHEQINRAVLLALGTRAGGEVVSEQDY